MEAPPLSGLPGAPLPGTPTGFCPVHVCHAPRPRAAGWASGLTDGAWQARPPKAPKIVFYRRQRGWEWRGRCREDNRERRGEKVRREAQGPDAARLRRHISSAAGDVL